MNAEFWLFHVQLSAVPPPHLDPQGQCGCKARAQNWRPLLTGPATWGEGQEDGLVLVYTQGPPEKTQPQNQQDQDPRVPYKRAASGPDWELEGPTPCFPSPLSANCPWAGAPLHSVLAGYLWQSYLTSLSFLICKMGTTVPQSQCSCED